jgi:FAD-linked sulfhydryl oxidase
MILSFQMLALTEIRAKSRKDLCVWLCEQHNLVNKKLGKPIFKCDMNTLDERWRKSKNPKCYE